MKKFCRSLCVILLIITLTSISVFAYQQVPDGKGGFIQPGSLSVNIQAHGAVVVDLDTSTLLYGKNMNEQCRPASLTKMMSLLVAFEQTRGRQDEYITVTREMVTVPAGSSSAGLLPGDRIRISDLFYAMMLPSGNDAARTLAYAVSGSEDDFVALMNQKAEALGMKNSAFCNSHGFDEDGHYTTPYDLSLLACELCRHEELIAVFSCARYTASIYRVNENGEESATSVGFVNSNNMVNPASSAYYEGIKGIKTGHTNLAGNCLATYYEKDDRHLVVIVTNDVKGQRDTDTQALIKACINAYTTFDLHKVLTDTTMVIDVENASLTDEANGQMTLNLDVGNESRIITLPSEAAQGIIKLDESILSIRRPIVKAPVRVGEYVGNVEYVYNNEVIYSAKALASRSVDAQVETPADLTTLGIKGHSTMPLFSVFKSGLFWAILLSILIIALAVVIIVRASRKKRRRVRLRQQTGMRRRSRSSSGRPGNRPMF